MERSAVIIGNLLLAFLIYVTLKGQLGRYISVVVGSPTPPTQGA